AVCLSLRVPAGLPEARALAARGRRIARTVARPLARLPHRGASRGAGAARRRGHTGRSRPCPGRLRGRSAKLTGPRIADTLSPLSGRNSHAFDPAGRRSEEHTSELQSRENLVCRLLLEKKKNTHNNRY